MDIQAVSDLLFVDGGASDVLSWAGFLEVLGKSVQF